MPVAVAELNTEIARQQADKRKSLVVIVIVVAVVVVVSLLLLLLLLIDPPLLLLPLLVLKGLSDPGCSCYMHCCCCCYRFGTMRDLLIDAAADQFFAVSSKAKRIGVPPLLRIESTTRKQHCN